MDYTYCFIINSASNSGKANQVFRSKEKMIRTRMVNSSFLYIGKEDSIRDTVKAAALTHDVIVACGGDGTVKEVANSVLEANSILGVLPLGSGNDFAKSIGLSRDFDSNFEILANNEVKKIDVLAFNGDHFLNTLGIGLDGLTNYYAAKLQHKAGKFRYLIGGLLAIVRAKPFDVYFRVGNQKKEQKTWMIVAANGAVEGGKYKISPNSNNSDGVFELNLVKNISRIRLAIQFLKLSLGFTFNRDVINQYQLKECFLKIESQQYAHADGEILCGIYEFDFLIREKILKVIVNK